MPSANSGKKGSIGFGEAVMIFIGMVIGSGVFFKPSRILIDVGGAPGLAILAWVLGAAMTIAAALSIAEVAAVITKRGGLMTYIKELYGEKWGFMLGWVQVLIYYPGLSAALAVVFATQCTTLISLTPMQQKFVSVGLIVFLTIVNTISVKFAAKFTVLFTIGKLVPIAAIMLGGLFMGKVHGYAPIVAETSTAAGFGAAVLSVLFAYGGWLNLTYLSTDLKNPEKDLPKAITMGICAVTLYILPLILQSLIP